MAGSVSARNVSSVDVQLIEPSDALPVHHVSLDDRVYSPKGVNFIGPRANRRNLLAATALLCFAVFSAGVRFGRSGVLREHFRKSDDADPSVASGRCRTTQEFDERGAALKKAIWEAKGSLQRRAKSLAGLQKKRDQTTETAKRLRDAIEQLSVLQTEERQAFPSRHEERDLLFQAIQEAKVKVDEGKTPNFAEILEEQRKILQREEAIAAKREKHVSDAKLQSSITREHESSESKEALVLRVEPTTEHQTKVELVTDVETRVKQLASTLKCIKARPSDLKVGSDLQRWKTYFDDALLRGAALREDFRGQQAKILVSAQVRTHQLVKDVSEKISSFRQNHLDPSRAKWPKRTVLEEMVKKAVERHASAFELLLVRFRPRPATSLVSPLIELFVPISDVQRHTLEDLCLVLVSGICTCGGAATVCYFQSMCVLVLVCLADQNGYRLGHHSEHERRETCGF